MIKYKTIEDIRLMQVGGKILREVVDELLKFVRPGVSTGEIDLLAEKEIKKRGGESSFKSVPGYFWSTCLPVNEQVVHTPPSKRVLKAGDVLTIDIGVKYKGFHTDYATTFVVDNGQKKEVNRFLEVGQETLNLVIKKAKTGNHIGDISKEIEQNIYKNGYHILKELTGHGIGRDLHEDPFVLGFLDREVNKTLKLQAGLVLAIEVIYSMGTEKIAYEAANDWSIRTKDSSLSACFEKTVAIMPKETIILT